MHNDSPTPETTAPEPTAEITFADLELSEPIQRALRDKQYTTPSPIQARAIPPVLAGRDLLGAAQTGTGKTAAFCLPLLHRLSTSGKPAGKHRFRALILTPTRELAQQIGDNLALYGKHLNLRHTIIYGGVGQNPQVRALQRGVDILIATPGRLLDLHNQGYIKFDGVEILVLDEADRMLDMGFIHDVKKVVSQVPAQRQSLFFSATLAPAVATLAESILDNPERVTIAAKKTTADGIDQRLCFVNAGDKPKLLEQLLREQNEAEGLQLTLIFSRTKHGANRMAQGLCERGFPAEAIHGNKSQAARLKALDRFRRGQVRVLVATDVAARGIDVKGITLVVNHDLPEEAESYVHRIGRTARAGAEGFAVSFCSSEEIYYLREIERLIRKPIPVLEDQPFHDRETERLHNSGARVRKPARGGQGGRGGGQRPQGRGARQGGGNQGPRGNRNRQGGGHGHGGGGGSRQRSEGRPRRFARSR